MRNAVIRFCNSPNAAPYLAALGNEVVGQRSAAYHSGSRIVAPGRIEKLRWLIGGHCQPALTPSHNESGPTSRWKKAASDFIWPACTRRSATGRIGHAIACAAG